MENKILFNSYVQRKKKIILLAVLILGTFLVVSVGGYFTFVYHKTNDDFKYHENEEIKIFQKYLRFPTVSLKSNLRPCAKFLKGLAHELNLKVSVLYPANKKNPVVLMTWRGQQPELPSILLNSHMDVVPVATELWKYPPFGAHIDENGNIYARGTQDMKSVGMLYLAAIRAMKRKGIKQLKRTIHLTYVPDEEVGGRFGMRAFVNSAKFKGLNVGCALDGGYPSESSTDIDVFYVGKTSWWVFVNATGNSGHSSILFENTAVDKLNFVMNKFLELRMNESRKLNELHYPYSNVTVINLTILKGGIKKNIVPPQMRLFVDMRLAVDADWDELENKIMSWGREAGGNLTIKIKKGDKAVPTRIDDSNPYWVAFKNATEQINLNVHPTVNRASTDIRMLREINIPAFGFSPLLNTTPHLHENDEFLNINSYLRGIGIYEKIIEAMANSN